MAGTGSKLLLKIGDETGWGTEAVRTHAINIEGETLTKRRDPLKAAIVYGSGFDVNEEAQGGVRCGGDLKIRPHYGGGWMKVFKHAMGTVVSSQPDPTNAVTVYLHTITKTLPLPDGLTLELDKDTAIYTSIGGKVSWLRLHFSAQTSLLEFTPSLICKDESLDTETTGLSASTTPLIRGIDAAVTWGGSSVNVYSLDFDLNNDLLDDEGPIGTEYIDEPVPGGHRALSGSFTARFTSTAQYVDYLAATSRQLVVTATGAVISGAYTYKFTMTMPYVRLRGSTPNVSSPGRIPITHPFDAMDSGANSGLTITVQNTDATV